MWRTLGASGSPLLAWLPAIAWVGLIFLFPALPNLRFAPDEGLDFLARKAGHMAVFGILALLSWRRGEHHRVAPAVGLGAGAHGPIRDHGRVPSGARGRAPPVARGRGHRRDRGADPANTTRRT